MEINRIYNMDCVEGMKLLPNDFVDLTVTSPPYDNLRDYNGFSFDFKGIAKELFRVTKQGGVVVWVVGDATVKGSETGTSFRQALYFKEIGFNIHDIMIYAKENYVPLTHRRYEQQFEYMFIFSKGSPATFNPIKIPCKNAGIKIQRESKYEHAVRGRKRTFDTSENKIKPNIWFYKIGTNCTTKDKAAFRHPAMFPEQLANDHIISWSNPDDIVLDPFIGSGTTAKMAVKTGRKYIGFEISKEYCDIANERIDICRNQISMFGGSDG